MGELTSEQQKIIDQYKYVERILPKLRNFLMKTYSDKIVNIEEGKRRIRYAWADDFLWEQFEITIFTKKMNNYERDDFKSFVWKNIKDIFHIDLSRHSGLQLSFYYMDWKSF